MKMFLLIAAIAVTGAVLPFSSSLKAEGTACYGCCSGAACNCAECTCCDCATCPNCSK